MYIIPINGHLAYKGGYSISHLKPFGLITVNLFGKKIRDKFTKSHNRTHSYFNSIRHYL